MNGERSRGFSLVEVMVAIVILAIGLVGLASLQMTGLKNNQSAYHRSIATILANDIADRMKANPNGVKLGHYNNGIAADVAATVCEGNSICTASDMARYDLKKWNDALARKLPGGKGMVCSTDPTKMSTLGYSSSPTDGCVATANSDFYVIRIWWDDDRTGAVNQGFTTSLQP